MTQTSSAPAAQSGTFALGGDLPVRRLGFGGHAGAQVLSVGQGAGLPVGGYDEGLSLSQGAGEAPCAVGSISCRATVSHCRMCCSQT